MTHRRRAIVTALAVAAAVVVPSAVLPAASQAAAYRYWSYWLGSEGAWTFANVGPAFRIPADGTLEGWRFSVSGVEGNRMPSFDADFEAVCGNTASEEGRKRVAVVVDPGGAEDAPEGEQPPGAWAMCVVAEPRATGYDVLRAAATVRAERGLICGIGGYPARGCADVTAEPTPTPTKSPKPSPKPSRSPEPTKAPENTQAPESGDTATDAAVPELSESSSPAPTSAESSSRPSASPTSAPPVTPTPTTSPSDIATASPTPSPTYSLLTAPLQDPPSDSGIGGALVAGIAVVGIAGLGGAAILRMRRNS
jgi:hypothetical protein